MNSGWELLYQMNFPKAQPVDLIPQKTNPISTAPDVTTSNLGVISKENVRCGGIGKFILIMGGISLVLYIGYRWYKRIQRER